MPSRHSRATWRALLGLALLASALAPLAARPALAAGTVSLTALGAPYTQDFNTLASSSGTANTAVPAGWEFSESGTNANTTYRAGTGSDNTGDTYSFGATGSAERAFGGLRSGSLVPLIGAQFTNSTGGTITSLTISYTGEQWRLGQNTTGRAADRLDFQLSTDATSLTAGAWADYDALDFASPVVAGTVGGLNGNVTPNRTALSFTITGLSIASGASFWIRWADTDLIPGADDGLSVDDFSLTPSGDVADSAPAVTQVAPPNGATGVAPNTTITLTFSEPVNVDPAAITLVCAGSAVSVTASAAAGVTSLTLDPVGDLPIGVSCTLTVPKSAVSDVDGNDPPDTLTVDFTTAFSVVAPCAASDTAVGVVQGSGATTPVPGQAVTVQGVVVGDYEGPSPALRGFYLQDAGDGNPATSDGIFVFASDNLNRVSLGDVVQVTGTANENQGQTQIAVTSVERCGATGSVTPADVTLPFAAGDAAERYEGMLVRLPQTLYVTEHFQLGRFGQVVLSSGGRLRQPTNVTAPGAAANALQAENSLNRIIIDDASQAQNPDPIVFGRGGQPLSAANTLRGGDTATGLVGVMTFTWGGNSASPNAYRVRPINALGGAINFQPANPRPAAAPERAGSVRVAAMNLLNFFNTFAGCTNGAGGAATDCRGANSATEFARQWPKTVDAIVGTGADVVGVIEVENDGYGSGSALAFLVAQLNAAAGPGTYAFVDVDAATGQSNALGTDAIKVGLIYKPAVVTPVGQTAALNTVAFVNGGDGAPRSRPALAQAFAENATGARFVVSVNHFKSKGSACDAPDAGDGQGNCNQVRVNAANELAAWLAGDPTGTGDPDVLIVGDLNSYAQEDPITTLRNAGYGNLIEDLLGSDAYSYAFDGQWGYLDHALGSASLKPQVKAVAEWHINADEPSVLDYNTEFKTANLITSLYAPDEFRISDHDPVLVDLAPNAPPTVAAGGPYTVAEGGSVNLSATGGDPNADDALSYAWDLDNDGSFETDGQSAPFSAALLDGPASATVQVRATDRLGLTATATATVSVTNVAPTVSAAFGAASVACSVASALTVTFADPGAGDTHTAVINWGDGSAPQTVAGASSPFIVSHTYARAGAYSATVTVTDDDGGSGSASAATAVRYTVVGGGLLQPINQDGSSVFKYGSTIPVKVRFQDCDGSYPANLAPRITLRVFSGTTPVGEINEPISTSAADANGVLRYDAAAQQYIYNLATRPLPDPTATYEITIAVPATGQTVTARFGLR